jgi:hypothetical protein
MPEQKIHRALQTAGTVGLVPVARNAMIFPVHLAVLTRSGRDTLIECQVEKLSGLSVSVV